MSAETDGAGPMTKRAEIKATILAAAAAFEQCPDLWCQVHSHKDKRKRPVYRLSHSDGDRYCAHGIVATLEGDGSGDCSSAPFVGGLTMYWNDQPGRTVSQVVAKMREIAGEL